MHCQEGTCPRTSNPQQACTWDDFLRMAGARVSVMTGCRVTDALMDCPEGALVLCEHCLSSSPKERPTAAELVARLCALEQSGQ